MRVDATRCRSEARPSGFVIFQCFRSSFPTTMSYPYLPAELLDDVVDLLQDRSEALKGCCLVAKSWIHRARRHLFARIALPDVASLQSWKTAFPDPSTSPACYTRSLGIKYPWDIMVEDTEEGSWIPAFSRVAYFELVIPTWARSDTDREMSLVPFHTFSPALGSIRVAVAADVPFLHVSNFIHSSLAFRTSLLPPAVHLAPATAHIRNLLPPNLQVRLCLPGS